MLLSQVITWRSCIFCIRLRMPNIFLKFSSWSFNRSVSEVDYSSASSGYSVPLIIFVVLFQNLNAKCFQCSHPQKQGRSFQTWFIKRRNTWIVHGPVFNLHYNWVFFSENWKTVIWAQFWCLVRFSPMLFYINEVTFLPSVTGFLILWINTAHYLPITHCCQDAMPS